LQNEEAVDKVPVSFNKVREAISAVNDDDVHRAVGLIERLPQQRRAEGYSRLLNQCAKVSPVETVESVLERYERFCRGHDRNKPDVRDYTNVVLSYGRHGLLEAAFARVEKMTQRGPAPNTITYNILVNACCKAGDMELAGNHHTHPSTDRERLRPTRCRVSVVCVARLV